MLLRALPLPNGFDRRIQINHLEILLLFRDEVVAVLVDLQLARRIAFE